MSLVGVIGLILLANGLLHLAFVGVVKFLGGKDPYVRGFNRQVTIGAAVGLALLLIDTVLR